MPEFSVEGSWVLSRQNSESMNRQCDAALKGGYLGTYRLQLCFCLRNISLRLLTCLRQDPSETQRILCDLDILFRDGETKPETAQLRVEPAHISQNGNQTFRRSCSAAKSAVACSSRRIRSNTSASQDG
jgi:hypothetical protein